MDIHTNIPLNNYVTMHLGGNARFMADVHSPAELSEVISRANSEQLPVYILGSGSNTIVPDEGFPGLVLRIRIPGFEVISETPQDVTIKVGAGENWDEVVKRTVERGLIGIECLSAIPGTTGAAPVQNIGAYGQEVSETIVSVDVYDRKVNQYTTLPNDQCKFSYRSSIFREGNKNQYVITAVTFRLYKAAPQPPFYQAVQDYLDAHNQTIYTPQVLRDAVIAIRSEKLPDPSERPNNGSFFKNAIVEDWQLNDLKKDYPDIPTYDMPDGRFKVPTGWLIEQAGFKGQLINGIRVHDKNALVLINESASGYADLAAAREQIMGAVRDKFRVQIEQEPLEMRI